MKKNMLQVVIGLVLVFSLVLTGCTAAPTVAPTVAATDAPVALRILSLIDFIAVRFSFKECEYGKWSTKLAHPK